MLDVQTEVRTISRINRLLAPLDPVQQAGIIKFMKTQISKDVPLIGKIYRILEKLPVESQENIITFFESRLDDSQPSD